MNWAFLYAQEEPTYFISDTNEGQFLVFGNRIPITALNGSCIDTLEDHKVTAGDKFIVVHAVDEMGNDRGVLIFDKKGGQINYDIVQKERAKYYQYFSCCVFVKELNEKLYFWDITGPYEGHEDYDCYYDSQTDASDYLIPRYYIFEYESNSVETVILQNECLGLIENGEIACN